jgi:fused signal recognition particle receptor
MILQFLKSSVHNLQHALSKSRTFLVQRLKKLFNGQVNDEAMEELERILYESDLGVKASTELVQSTKLFLKSHPQATASEIIEFLQKNLIQSFDAIPHSLKMNSKTQEPTVLLIVGANGNGKTTSCAKLAYWLKSHGKSVLIAAADTFRAGAQEQLKTWAERIGVDCVMGTYKSDPAAVVFDACSAAKARGVDVLLVDTAGRLENKSHLMRELEKIRRSCEKNIISSPHETLLVLDATIGQNGLEQAKSFHQATPLTGIILTKMDGTAKGGIALSIQRELSVPIKFLGLGEKIQDFANFDAQTYIKALFGAED